MANKPHLKLNTDKQFEPAEGLKFNYGFGEMEEKDETSRNYSTLANEFRNYLDRYNQDSSRRIANRSIELPEHIDYIKIQFQSQFEIKEYFGKWYNEFGLLGVNFSKFNSEALFAVIDSTKFRNTFIESIENFILKETAVNLNANYNGKVLFIKEFKFFSSTEIIHFQENPSLLNLRLIDFPTDSEISNRITSLLEDYLTQQKIKYQINEERNNIELYETNSEKINEIVDNFDVVLSVTSSLSTVIGPSEFNTEKRSYGFEIANPKEDLPIIGIIDTGISNMTPLNSILISDEGFNLTSTSPIMDNAYDGYGHGTAVAALAALGRTPYSMGYRGKIPADAKLLSIKILDDKSGYISEKDLLQLLKKAKIKYPEIKIFVLTTCYENSKTNNEDFSTYAYELDKFSHENDCLIFICTANNYQASNENKDYDLNYFSNEASNLCSPAESLNNIIIGAAANPLREGAFYGISFGREFPTLYSRKSHFDLASLFSSRKRNKNYFRPDVIECGGDYEQSGNNIGTGDRATMEVLSAKPEEGFKKEVGTSLSTPLVANIAAKIQKAYPDLKAQTIKALIVNNASLDNILFPDTHIEILNKVAGNGIVDPDKSFLSNDNSITFIIEEKIAPETVKSFPINFPEYLIKEKLGKKGGLIKITATLCFSFEPVLANQLAYCPIHIAFTLFRNHSIKEILTKEGLKKSVLRKRWSQNGRDISRPIPYFNTQKISFLVGVKELISEKSTFKIAVNSRITSQLIPGTEIKYQKEHAFSIVIKIEENLAESRLTNNLYSGMEAINEIENIATLNNEETLEAES